MRGGRNMKTTPPSQGKTEIYNKGEVLDKSFQIWINIQDYCIALVICVIRANKCRIYILWKHWKASVDNTPTSFQLIIYLIITFINSWTFVFPSSLWQWPNHLWSTSKINHWCLKCLDIINNTLYMTIRRTLLSESLRF